MPEIQIQSNDGQIFQVDFSVARMSNTIRTMLDDLGVTPEDAVNQIVPVHNVKSDILKKVWRDFYVIEIPLHKCRMYDPLQCLSIFPDILQKVVDPNRAVTVTQI